MNGLEHNCPPPIGDPIRYEPPEEPLTPFDSPEQRPVKLTNEERLAAENLQLRAMATTHRKQLMLYQLRDLDQQLVALNAETNLMQQMLQHKYGIDFSTHAIEPGTGRVILGGK